MKLKSISKLIFASVILSSMHANAQTSGTLFFDSYNPRQHWENPANTPEGKFYIGMPALSNISVAGGNKLFAFDDLFRNITRDSVTRTVPIISEDLDETDNFINRIKFNERLNASYRINLIECGFRIKDEHYFTFGISNRMESMVIVPNQFFKLFFNGMSNHEVYDFNINKLSATANIFSEVDLGYSRTIGEKLNVGGKLKLLFGHGSLQTKLQDLKVTGSEHEWCIKGEGDIYGSIPNVKVIANNDKTIKEFRIDDDAEATSWVQRRGFGLGLDLGATYQVFDNLKVAASLLDFGFIKYKEANIHLKKANDFIFKGIDYEIGNDSTDFLKEIGEDLEKAYEVDNSLEGYTTHLSLKFNLGAEYNFWENRVSVGVLSRTHIFCRSLWEEFYITANFRPFRWVSTSLAYNIGNGQWNNLNAALDFNLGPVNLYFAMDNIPFRLGKINDAVFPIKTRSISFSTGMAFVMGYKEKKESH